MTSMRIAEEACPDGDDVVLRGLSRRRKGAERRAAGDE